jgi:hypothetical protein
MQGVKLGFFTLAAAAAAAMAGCSDPENTPNGTGGNAVGGSAGTSNAGSGGSGMSGGGMGGNAPGTGGSSGGGGSPGTGGTGQAGTGNDAGVDGGGGPPCTGCVELRVPVTAINQTTLFQFAPATPADFSTGTVTFKVRGLTLNDQLGASPFAQNSFPPNNFPFVGQFEPLSAANGFVDEDTWVDLAFDIGAQPPPDIIPPNADAGADAGPGTPDLADFDKSRVSNFGLSVGSAGAFTGALTVTVLVDSVTFTGVDTNALPNVTFDATAEGFVVNTFADVEGSVVIHHPL